MPHSVATAPVVQTRFAQTIVPVVRDENSKRTCEVVTAERRVLFRGRSFTGGVAGHR
jgi:hypothetical protein